VSFDCPCGPADIIDNGKDGFLIELENTDFFAKAIIRLIENREDRMKMGKMAKKNVSRFSSRKIMPIWNDLFKELIIKA
jgi:glycosyltransferase involved in cell wall biosynthesis